MGVENVANKVVSAGDLLVRLSSGDDDAPTLKHCNGYFFGRIPIVLDLYAWINARFVTTEHIGIKRLNGLV